MDKQNWTNFRNLKIINNDIFFESCQIKSTSSEIFNNIDSGDVYVVKKVIEKNEVDDIISRILRYDFEISENPKIVEGIKNIKYYSLNNSVIKNEEIGYNAIDISYYFFPWNNDDLGILKKFQILFDIVIKINGYNPDIIKKNTPIDGVVQRFHLIHYPLNSGEISLHIDPTNIVKVNSGIYFSEYGVDYKDGGFYVADAKKGMINLDEIVEKGDLILFSPNLAHGVKKVSKVNEKLNSGRYFFNMSLIESHEVSDRQNSVGLRTEGF